MVTHTPAILKPKVLYTGKQVISTLLDMLMFDPDAPDDRSRDSPPLNMAGKSKLSPAAGWGEEQEEHKVLFRGNWLVRGVLDKAQFGSSSHGLVHSFFEVYGAIKTGSLLTALARLFTAYSQRIGAYTCSIHDMIIKKDADIDRTRLIEESENVGMEAAIDWVTKDMTDTKKQEKRKTALRNSQFALRCALRDRVFAEGKGHGVLDDVYKKGTMASGSSIIKRVLPSGLLRSFPYNCMSLMVQTGAKGSMVNHSQISCLLGQQELEGSRVPVMVSGKSLPSFPAFDPRPRAGGFISDRFLTGIRPQDYFFHCMSGREGLVDTAVKTSRSGYLQRCLIKHMEDLMITYDQTVRDSDGSVIQFQYGEDGIDPTKTCYLGEKEKELDFIVENMPALMHKYTIGPNFFNNLTMVNDSYARSELALVERARERYEEEKKRDGPTILMIGDVVRCRRLKRPLVRKQEKSFSFVESYESDDSIVGGVYEGWHEAIVTKVREGGTRVDLEYRRPMVGDVILALRMEAWEEGAANKKASPAVVIKQNFSDNSYDVRFTDPEHLTDSERRHVGLHRIKCPTLKKVPLRLTVPDRVAGSSKDKSTAGATTTTTEIVHLAVPDPSNSISGTLHTSKHIGCVSERQQKLIRDYCAKPEKQKLLAEHGLNQEALEILLWVKALRASADPGEAVGALAGQSIGEPSTQMTLNTFHLAGVGGGNVTLGIPRLREILMTAAKKLKTPLMYLPVDPRVAAKNGGASISTKKVSLRDQGKSLSEDLAAKLGILTLDALLDHHRRGPTAPPAVMVRENIHRSHHHSPAERRYVIRLRLASLKSIAKTYSIDFGAVREAFGSVFLPKLLAKCGHALRQSGAITSISQVTGGAKNKLDKESSERSKSQGDVAQRGGDDSEDEEVGRGEDEEAVDGDEQGSVSFGKRKQIVAYGEDDGEDDDDSGSDNSSSSDSDDDENDDKVAAVKSGSSGSSSSSSSSSSDDVVHLTHEITGNVSRSPLFVNATASGNPSNTKNGDAWMEVVLTTPVAYKKIMMLALVESLVKEVLIFSTRSIKNTYVLPPARGQGDEGLWRVQTDGVNFQAAWNMIDVGVNPNTVRSFVFFSSSL